MYATLPFIGYLSCNKIKRLIQSIVLKIYVLDLKFVLVKSFYGGLNPKNLIFKLNESFKITERTSHAQLMNELTINEQCSLI